MKDKKKNPTRSYFVKFKMKYGYNVNNTYGELPECGDQRPCDQKI